MRRRLALVPLVLAGALAIAGCGGGGDDENTTTSASAGGGQLFAQTSHTGSLTPIQGKNDVFTLTLDQPSPDVTSFTDRPIRSAGTEPLPDFVNNWDTRGFGQNPPNAALVLDQQPDNADTAVFTLANPSLDQKSGAVSYEATHITGGTASLPSDEHVDPPPHFGDAHLFIDPSTTPTVDFFVHVATQSHSAKVTITLDAPYTVYVGAAQQQATFIGAIGGGVFGGSNISLTGPGEVDVQLAGGAGPVTGTATVASGMNVTVEAGNGPTQQLKTGKFSAPAS